MKREKDGRPTGRPETLTPVQLDILRTLRGFTPPQCRRALDLVRQIRLEEKS